MTEQEITIESSTKGAFLSGTLFSSKSDLLVLLFSGSGAQDRHESIASKKPFKVLSEGLIKNGYDTFSWDDRGIGKSEGDYYESDSNEIIEDGRIILKYFRNNHHYENIILLGHSQGTLVATRVALESSADALILCAGIFRDGKTALLEQHREICVSENWPVKKIESSLQEKEAIFDLLINFEKNKSRKSTAKIEELLWDHFLQGSDKEQLSTEDHQLLKEVIDDLSEWEWRYILTETSLENIKQLSIPILTVFGGKDVQVNSKQEAALLKQASQKNITIQTLVNHNHLFQESSFGGLNEYHELGDPFSSKTIAVITEWIKDCFK